MKPEFLFFLKLSNIPLYVHTTFGLSIHLLMDTSWYHLLATVNNAAMNVDVQIYELQLSILWGIYLEVNC